LASASRNFCTFHAAWEIRTHTWPGNNTLAFDSI
jgi:hypothetical protein